jgi:hypothetical protein
MSDKQGLDEGGEGGREGGRDLERRELDPADELLPVAGVPGGEKREGREGGRVGKYRVAL